jgi:hypothetical protein
MLQERVELLTRRYMANNVFAEDYQRRVNIEFAEKQRKQWNAVEEVIQRSAFGKQYGKWSKEVRQLTEEVCEVLGIKQ